MRRSVLPVLALLVALAGCSRAFNVRDFSTSSALYDAGMAKFRDRRWNDAILAFERLTLDLPARDTLLPLSHWHLAQARLSQGERLLAAQAFIKLSEVVPDDSLADDALFLSGRAYAGLWRRPSLDPQYGLLAQSQFRLLKGVYPESPLADSATGALRRLDERFAAKDYDTGLHYIRRKAYDSAILYLRDVVKNWPESDLARLAMLRLVEVYRLPVMNYETDAAEVCDALRGAFPTDADVLTVCKLAPRDSAAAIPPAR